MGTISDKLTYLNETKSQLKDMINYGLPSEEQITSSTTFRNYVLSIFNAFLEALRTPDTLFTNLPKKSGTGANISLNDTANAPMRIELGASELSQDGTPTPSLPQAVHSISGSNTIRVEGKNLIPYQNKDFTINGINFKTINGNLILNGTATASITGDMLVNDNYLKIDVKSTTYYLTRTNINSGLTINLMNEYNTVVAQLTRGSTDLSTTFTVSSINKVYLGFFIPQGSTFNNYDGGIMVSTTDTTYEPYISQEAEIDLSSKNLFDEVVETGRLNTSTGENVADNSYYRSKNYIEVEPNTTYYLYLGNVVSTAWIGIGYYGTSKEFVSWGGAVTTQQTFTTPANCKYIRFYIGTPYYDKICINLNDANVNGKYYQYYTPIEYCKIGNYEDKFIRTSGKNLAIYNTISNLLGYSNYCDATSTGGKKEWFELVKNLPKGIELIGNWTYTSNGTAVSSISGVWLRIYYTDSTYTTADKGTAFTIDSTKTLDHILVYGNQSQTADSWTEIQFVKGSTILPYEPYGSNEWYIKKNIGKVVLDGNITLNYNGTAGMFYSANQTQIPNYKASTPLLSNYLQYSSTTWVKNCFGITGANVFWLYIENGPTSLADLQTWLSTHNLDIRYVLNTPTYTQITGTLANQLENVYQKLLSYSGTTNISQINNDLGFNLSVSAIEEL